MNETDILDRAEEIVLICFAIVAYVSGAVLGLLQDLLPDGDQVIAMAAAAKTVRRPHSMKFTEPSKTKQSFADETDIHAIIRKYEQKGVYTVNPREPLYGDFTNVDDYLDAKLRVSTAQAAFADLPSELRDAAANDPAELLRMVATEEGRAQLEELGMEFDENGAAASFMPPDPEQIDAPEPDPSQPDSAENPPNSEEPAPEEK